MKFQRICDQLCPADDEAVEWYAGLDNGDAVKLQVVSEKRRTPAQNNAMWKYCEMLAGGLNDAGWDMRTFPWKKGLSIPFSKYSVMESFWRPIMDALFARGSTTGMSPKEVNEIYMAVDKAVSERTGVTVEFPSIER